MALARCGHSCHMSRYAIEPGRGFTRMMWRIRARVCDRLTGEDIDVRSADWAAEIRLALERADADDLDPLPNDASPFRRFEVMTGNDGWFYLSHAEGASIMRHSRERGARTWHTEPPRR